MNVYISEMEAIEQHKKEKEAAISSGLTTTANPSYTPDYAAGLLAPATPVRFTLDVVCCVCVQYGL